MLTPDVRLEGFDTQDWVGLWAMLGPSRGAAPADGGGGVIAIQERKRLRKLLHTRTGVIELNGHPWPMDAEALAAAHGARWAVVLEVGALDAVMERSAEQMKADDDLLEQVLGTWRAARAVAREGKLDAWPGSLRTVPVPTKELVLRAMDLFVPDGQCVVMGAWEEGRLHTSVALRRSGGGFDTVLGPCELREEMGVMPGDLRAAHRRLCDLVSRRLGRVALGLSARREQWSEIVGQGEAGHWARLVAAGRVIVQPMPTGVALPIAVDAGRVAYLTVRAMGRRMGLGGPERSGDEQVPELDLWTMLRAWAGLGVALRGHGLGGRATR